MRSTDPGGRESRSTGYSDLSDPDRLLTAVRESGFGSLMLLVGRLPRCELVTQVKPVVEGRALRRGHHPEPGMAAGPLASGHDALCHQPLVVEVGAHELDRFHSHAPEAVGAGDVLAVPGAAKYGADERRQTGPRA